MSSKLLVGLRRMVTFGEVVSEGGADAVRAAPRGNETYNGAITSSVIFLLLMSVSTSQTLSVYLDSVSNQRVGAHAILIVYMVAGLLTMFAFCRCHPRIATDDVGPTELVADAARAEEEDAWSRDHSPRNLFASLVRQTLREKLPLVGITVFFVFGCLLDIFHIIVVADCADAWRRCGPSTQRRFVVSSLFHSLRVVFVAAELIFCYQHHRRAFLDRWLVRYGLAIVQAANASLWLDAVFYEFDEHKEDLTSSCTTPPADGAGGELSTLNDTRIVACLRRNNREFGLLFEYFNPYLYPFLIEFTLLAGNVFAMFFIDCNKAIGRRTGVDIDQNQTAEGDREEERRPLLDMTIADIVGQTDAVVGRSDDRGVDVRELAADTSSRVSSTDEHCYSSIADSERRYLSLVWTTDDVSNRGLLSNDDADPMNDNSACAALSKFFLVVGVVVNILYCLLGVMAKNFAPIHNGVRYWKVFIPYNIVYWLISVVVIVSGYFWSGAMEPRRPSSPFAGLDYLVLFSSSGTFMSQVFLTSAVVGPHGSNITGNNESLVEQPIEPVLVGVLLGGEFLKTVAVLLQITFVLYAERIRPPLPSRRGPATGGGVVDRRAIACFKTVLLYLAVSNFAVWIEDIFVPKHLPLFGKYFDNIHYVKSVLTPLTLFFRFNCSLMFLRAYLNL